ncbi:hypothetical protein Cgig2_019523 [Carnegiea gigantea]|uniref:DUF4283 domain-containing protein n=1 Tax=Carnegiea gigantea TaxID=171969 RepID=A0A9Q1QJZ5_9CARY|nr:hypothetical protein Cgig2_019523 [Carnegiea gigantea]
MKAVLKNIWKAARDLNLFSFQLFPSTDKEFVLNKGSWAFDSHLLLLKEITGVEQPTNINFDKMRFWVNAYSAPLLKQTTDFARVLSSQLGTFQACDESNLYGGANNTGKPLWIKLRHVKLSDFCYGCGCLGHEVNSAKLQYEEWLRASPVKSKMSNSESKREEERKLFLAYQEVRGAGSARLKLKFGDTGSNEKSSQNQKAIPNQEVPAMMVDEA